MRLFSILSLLCLFSSCTHYQTMKLSKDRVIVSKTTNVLGIYGGTVFTCRTNDDGMFHSCDENAIESESEKKARAEKIEQEKQRKAMILQSSSEAPKRDGYGNRSP